MMHPVASPWVACRGFLGDTDDLTFVTDNRSSKIREVAANPAAEVGQPRALLL